MQKDKYKSIEMFEIKKLISKGTFGKVFSNFNYILNYISCY